ncbi:MAG: hypothetical protein FDX30_11155 [Chlorobium sp.]|nr:MAG: hypothetical protein FDX30_11155 [Chlorobium sp.]
MNKTTKKAMALAAAVTSLATSLGVGTLESQAAVDQANQQGEQEKLSNNHKLPTQGKLSTQHKISSQHKTSSFLKTSNQQKTSNQIKWEQQGK